MSPRGRATLLPDHQGQHDQGAWISPITFPSSSWTVAFVLHDMFAVPIDEIAPIVGRSPDATRQLASRARRRVQGTAAVPSADRARERNVADPERLQRMHVVLLDT